MVSTSNAIHYCPKSKCYSSSYDEINQANCAMILYRKPSPFQSNQRKHGKFPKWFCFFPQYWLDSRIKFTYLVNIREYEISINPLIMQSRKRNHRPQQSVIANLVHSMLSVRTVVIVLDEYKNQPKSSHQHQFSLRQLNSKPNKQYAIQKNARLRNGHQSHPRRTMPRW